MQRSLDHCDTLVLEIKELVPIKLPLGHILTFMCICSVLFLHFFERNLTPLPTAGGSKVMFGERAATLEVVSLRGRIRSLDA